MENCMEYLVILIFTVMSKRAGSSGIAPVTRDTPGGSLLLKPLLPCTKMQIWLLVGNDIGYQEQAARS